MVRILIGDDHEIIRKGLIDILKASYPAAHFEEACDAEGIIKKLVSETFNLVISDLSMPGKSGLDVVEQLKQMHPKLPVLILSMYPESQYAIRALKAGAAGYLCKDVATSELIKAVEWVLAGRKYISPFIAEKLANQLTVENPGPAHESLSNRELYVFKLLAEGITISGIAERLSLSITTVSTYRARLLKKMNMASNAELTRYALEHGIIQV
jgi:DNA-binding NarL/FixJ family response regulator